MIPSLLRRWPSGPGWRCGNRGHMVETSHLLLRRPRSGDLEAIKTVMDAEFIRWNGYPTDDEKLTAMATAWIHKVRRKPYRESWLICDRSSGDVIGMRTIMSDESDSRICATGSSLAPGWRGSRSGHRRARYFYRFVETSRLSTRDRKRNQRQHSSNKYVHKARFFSNTQVAI